MFEKEAEEYYNGQYDAWLEGEDSFALEEEIEQAFKDGAKFGYNKAMEEWKKHFLQCSSPFCSDIFSSVKCYGELGNMAKKEGEEK